MQPVIHRTAVRFFRSSRHHSLNSCDCCGISIRFYSIRKQTKPMHKLSCWQPQKKPREKKTKKHVSPHLSNNIAGDAGQSSPTRIQRQRTETKRFDPSEASNNDYELVAADQRVAGTVVNVPETASHGADMNQSEYLPDALGGLMSLGTPQVASIKDNQAQRQKKQHSGKPASVTAYTSKRSSGTNRQQIKKKAKVASSTVDEGTSGETHLIERLCEKWFTPFGESAWRVSHRSNTHVCMHTGALVL